MQVFQAPTATLNFSSVTSPIPQTAGNPSVEINKLIPVRPAPTRPDHVPKKKFALESQSVVSSSKAVKSASLQNTCEKSVISEKGGTSKVLSCSSSSRPNCPPPRPPPLPPSKPKSILKQTNCYSTYEDITKNGDDPESYLSQSPSYYDDCHASDFSEMTMPGFHKSVDNKKHNRTDKSEELSANFQKPNSNTVLISQISRTGENSVVAALTQKFEKQENNANKETENVCMRPPFKFRPLPPRPGDSEV